MATDRARPSSAILALAALAVLGTSLTACSNSDAHVRAELRRVGPGSSSAPSATNARRPRAQAAVTGTASQYAITSNVVIHSLKAPIMAISLATGTDTAQHAQWGTVYSCPAIDSGDPDQCMIELANVDSLQDLLASLVTGSSGSAIPPGTYTRMQVVTLAGPPPPVFDTWHGFLTAEATLGGVTYYTDPGSPTGMSTTGPAAQVSVIFNGGSFTYDLPTPVTLGHGDEVSVKLYFDLQSLVWVGMGTGTSTVNNSQGCTADDAESGPYICMDYPLVAATVDKGTPVVEHYLLNGQGTDGLYFTSGGQYFGGYTRQTWVEGQAPQGADVYAGQAMKSASPNADGTWSLVSYGLGADGPGSFNTTDFERVAVGDTSSGTFWTAYTGSQIFTYVAQRLD